jgi:hypothetical protein
VYQAQTAVSTTAQTGGEGIEIQASGDQERPTITPRQYVYAQ